MKENYVRTGRINQKLETRAKILNSAKRLLRKGLTVNLEAIATDAGISRATIYRYYSNVEILTYEAGLDINTKSQKEIMKELEGLSLIEQIRAVQDYYNNHAIEHENAFRQYLSAVLGTHSPPKKRGARRNSMLQMVLRSAPIPPKKKKDLVNLLANMMGIEPLIVSKDVSGVDNTEFKRLMTWGVDLILQSFFENEKR